MLKETITLLNGQEIPVIGLGTWQSSVEDAAGIVEFALNNGYIHIDGAHSYQNSQGSAVGIEKSNVAREDIWITTKVRGESKSYEAAKKNIEEELANFQTDYLDLVLIHCPTPWAEFDRWGSENRYFEENLEVWRAMTEAYEAGKIRAIGVSNFNVHDLKNLIENSDIKPMVNQISYRIGFTEDEIVQFCEQEGIVVEAYSPLGTGNILGNEDLAAVASKYDKSVAQLAIRYCIQRGHVVLPKTVHEKYAIQNAEVDFVISEEDMEYLNSLEF